MPIQPFFCFSFFASSRLRVSQECLTRRREDAKEKMEKMGKGRLRDKAALLLLFLLRDFAASRELFTASRETKLQEIV